MLIKDDSNYMFRPIVAMIGFSSESGVCVCVCGVCVCVVCVCVGSGVVCVCVWCVCV